MRTSPRCGHRLHDVLVVLARLCYDAQLQLVGDGSVQVVGSEEGIGSIRQLNGESGGASIQQLTQQSLEAGRLREVIDRVHALCQYPTGLAGRGESIARPILGVDGEPEERSICGSIGCRLRPAAAGTAMVSATRRRRRRGRRGRCSMRRTCLRTSKRVYGVWRCHLLIRSAGKRVSRIRVEEVWWEGGRGTAPDQLSCSARVCAEAAQLNKVSGCHTSGVT